MGPQLIVACERSRGEVGQRWWWQLVARNGRILGRSEARFPNAAAAAADFATLAAQSPELTLSVVHAEPRAGWVWRIADANNRTAVRAHRTYERHDSCRRSAGRALAALATFADDASLASSG